MAVKINTKALGGGTTQKPTTSTTKTTGSKTNTTNTQANKAAEAEKARQKRIKEIKDEIAAVENDLEELKQKQQQYKSMKGSISQAISQLGSASSNIATALRQLSGAYVSTAAEDGKSKMEAERTDIGTQISRLNTVSAQVEVKLKKVQEDKIALQKALNALKKSLEELL